MIISSEYLALRSGKNFKQSERKWIGTRLYNRINTRFVLCLEWFFWDYQRFQRIHSNYASIFSNIISDFAAQSSKFLLCCFQMLRGVECWTFSSNWIVASHFGELDLSIYYLHAYIPYLRTVMSKYTSPPSILPLPNSLIVRPTTCSESERFSIRPSLNLPFDWNKIVTCSQFFCLIIASIF